MDDANLFKKLLEYGADVNGIDERFMGDSAFYRDCMKHFVSDENTQKLGEALKAKDYTKAFEYAHSLKGLSGNMGLTPLYQAVCEIVEPLRSGDYTDLDAKYQKVVIEFARAKELV